MKKNCLIFFVVVFIQCLSFSQQIKRAPGCGTVGFDWKTPASIPTGDIFTGCPNTNYQLKADVKATANEYIAPGFGIVLGSGTMNISKVEISEGGGAYQDIGTIVNLPYSSPNYDYNIRINGTVVTGPVTINIVDHATGTVVATAPYTANVVIPIPKGTLKGIATFSGPGVSNYQLDYPSTGKIDYTANGYAIFNPSVAGNGTHTITYTWNNGTTACGSATKIVEVKDCPTPAVPCGTCATPDCPIGNVAKYANRNPPTGAQTCNSGLSVTGIYTTYQTVFADANGNLGAYCQNTNVSALTTVPTSVKITSKLFRDGDCGGTVIPTSNFNPLVGSTDNVANRSSTNGSWNPEWTSLTPNGKYILETTFTLGSGSKLTKYCMDYYGSTSCAAKIGTTKVTINGATPPTGKNLSANHYLLCKNDKIEFNTTGYTLPPVGGGGTAGIGYMPFVCPPTSGTAPNADACWGAVDMYDINNPSSDINDGSIISQFPSAINQTYYFVPVTMDEALPSSMKYDENSDGCYQTGTPIKVTYLKDITLSKNEVCASSKVVITISGGVPEFVSGTKYRISTNIGTLSANTLTSSGGTVELTGLSNGDNYTITVSDTTGCNKTITGTYTCTCAKPTITPTPAEVCHGATTTSFSYSGLTNSPDKYSITWNAAAIAAGFTNITDATLSTSPISVNIPVTASPQTYIGSLTVKNSTTGCVSTAQNISFGINGNPTLTATPPSILVGGTASISVSGGSGIGSTSNTWKTLSNTANTISGVTGNTQPITVTGVASGNEDVIYTDNKGCDDTVTIAVSILGCNTITKITPDQVWCQGIDPNAIEVSTNETATDGIRFIVYPAAIRPTTGAAVYSGGVPIKKVTPASGKASLDLPALGTLGSLPVTLAGDYYVYAILNPTPSNTACRPYAEIKVTLKDSIKPVITTTSITGNSTTFEWDNIIGVDKWGMKGAITTTSTPPTSWTDFGSISAAPSGTKNKRITNLIPLGSTAHLNITPQDINGVQLECSNSATASIQNPSCIKPDLLALNIPDTVCDGVSLDKLIGKISSTSVPVNFVWQASTDSINWTPVPSIPDFVITNPTANKETNLAIKSHLLMNNSFIRLIGKDLATGQCSDTTLPVKILVNEIPDASISISPNPAKLCVGDPGPIEVTFQGSKGVKPYHFFYKLDLVKKDIISVIPDSKVVFPFTTINPIEDSTFVLDSITDKNGCTAKFTGKTVKLEVVPVPKPEFQADKTIGCYPLEVIFTDKSPILNADVLWDFGNGDLDSTSLGVVKYIFQKSGDYTISFKSSINGCSDTTQKTNYIHVKDRPEAQFSPKKTNISLIDPEIQFVNSSSSNSVYYKWIFGDGSPVSNLVNPKHTYVGDGSTGLPNPGKYTVELYAYINQDCWDSTSTTITIDDEQIYYIPNTFTPNGDEKNNTFQPVFTSGYDPQNYHFFIYNRWGEVIFESNNPTIGWDGTYGSKLLANDTYTWKLQFKEKMTEKEHFLTGHVNLFK